MKRLPFALGSFLIVIGVSWLLVLVTSFEEFQHTSWIKHAQELSQGNTIARSEAISSMRSLSLRLSERVQFAKYPVTAIALGFALLVLKVKLGGANRQDNREEAEQGAASDRDNAPV